MHQMPMPSAKLPPAIFLNGFSECEIWLTISRAVNDATMAILIGLMVGSLRKIWPWKFYETNVWPNLFSLYDLLALCFVLLGVLMVFVLEKKSKIYISENLRN